MYDSSGMNLGENNETSNSVNDDEAEEPEPTIAAPLPPVGQVRIVQKLTRDQFHSRLLDHVDILLARTKSSGHIESQQSSQQCQL
jgi:hypothetical protein